jgi:hypothetical protein
VYEVSLWKITTGMERGLGLVFDIDMRCPVKKDECHFATCILDCEKIVFKEFPIWNLTNFDGE